MSRSFTIADNAIGAGRPCFVIAEAGVNHNGSLERALELVEIAAAAGAQAVKFQTFSAERLATRDARKAAYQIETTGDDQTQFEMLRALELSEDEQKRIAEHCTRRGVLFLSTPFDEESADELERVGVVAYKTPSGELTNLRYLQHVARKGKPMVVSTGMATLSEVEAAVDAIEGEGNTNFALLHCVSAYPAPPGTINLRAMHTLARAFDVPVGYSDHTLGTEIALASVALGACVLEKHFTQSRALPGPDHRASLHPDELAAMIRGLRDIEAALGDGRKRPSAIETSTAAAARKSLVAARAIAAGDSIADGDLAARRPGTGIPLNLRLQVVGRVARVPIAAGTLIGWEMLG